MGPGVVEFRIGSLVSASPVKSTFFGDLLLLGRGWRLFSCPECLNTLVLVSGHCYRVVSLVCYLFQTQFSVIDVLGPEFGFT